MTSDIEYGEWSQLLDGARYDYRAGRIIGELRVEALAHSLAGINRYGAWTPVYWSVASHACLVSEIIAAMATYDDPTVLLGHHHDDHESLGGELTSPFKAAMSAPTRAELSHHAKKADRAIWRGIGIMPLIQVADDESRMAVVKAADIAALEAERRWLMVPRMRWATEDIVNARMLEAGERILAAELKQIPGGPESAARFVRNHSALVARIGAV